MSGGPNYNGAQTNPAVAWVCSKEEVKVFRALFKFCNVPVKVEETHDYTGLVTFWTFRVLNKKDFWRAREIRRGFKVAWLLRGDVKDFLEGLQAGLFIMWREKKLELPEDLVNKLLPPPR